MRPGEFVYKAIRDEALKKGADLVHAEEQARIGVTAYRKNQFDKKVVDLIAKHVAEAVAQTKRRMSA